MHISEMSPDMVKSSIASIDPSEHVELEFPFFTTGTNLSISLGIPLSRDSLDPTIAWMKIPESPRLVHAGVLRLIDPRLPFALSITDVTVLLAHGFRRYGHWYFGNDQHVINTARTYNHHAGNFGFPKIEFIFACNEESADPNSPFYYEEYLKEIAYPKDGIILGDSYYTERYGLYLRAQSTVGFANIKQLALKKPDSYVGTERLPLLPSVKELFESLDEPGIN